MRNFNIPPHRRDLFDLRAMAQERGGANFAGAESADDLLNAFDAEQRARLEAKAQSVTRPPYRGLFK